MSWTTTADSARTETAYASGDWQLLRGAHTWLLVDASDGSELRRACARAVTADAGTDQLLGALVSAGFAETPAFALVRLARDERRVVVRGGAVVYLMGATSSVVLATPGTTWTDTLIAAEPAQILMCSTPLDQQPWWLPVPDGEPPLAASAVRLIPVGALPAVETDDPSRDPALPGAEPPLSYATIDVPTPTTHPAESASADEGDDSEAYRFHAETMQAITVDAARDDLTADVPPDEPAVSAPAEDADLPGTDYGFLWAATQRGVSLASMGLDEHAAVTEAVGTAAAATPAAGTAPAAALATSNAAATAPDRTFVAEAHQARSDTRAPLHPARTSTDTTSTDTATPHSDPQLSTADGLIDAVPWARSPDGGIAPSPASAPPISPTLPVAAAHPSSASTQPMARTDPSTSVAQTLPTTSISTSEIEQTVNRAAIAAAAAAAAGEILSCPTVLAARCPSGHLTPVAVPRCRICRAPVAVQHGIEISRPNLGVLRLSTGDVVTLDRGVILGRAPEAPNDLAERPNVLRLPSPYNDLSRSHAEVFLDGWNVYLRDLDSTNGTTVSLPGQPPVRLRARDPFLLEPGALVNLADEVNIQFEVVA